MDCRSKYLSIFVVLAFLYGCAQSNFSGGSAPAPKGSRFDKKQDSRPPTTGGTPQRAKSCWVAISGAKIGMVNDNSESSFPRTKSGKPIGHGEVFDSKGGVFLESRSGPYMFESSAGRSDISSILIAPGMILEFDAWGDLSNQTFKQEGPFIGYFSVHDLPENQAFEEQLRAKPDLPLWVSDYLKRGPVVAKISLIPLGGGARAIKVSAVAGGVCDDGK